MVCTKWFYCMLCGSYGWLNWLLLDWAMVKNTEVPNVCTTRFTRILECQIEIRSQWNDLELVSSPQYFQLNSKPKHACFRRFNTGCETNGKRCNFFDNTDIRMISGDNEMQLSVKYYWMGISSWPQLTFELFQML